MFDKFSKRAMQIMFAARLKAGERGAEMIDTDDLIVGFVLEDQGMLAEVVFSKIFEGQGTPVNMVPCHLPFFASKMAQNLLAELEKNLPQSRPVSLATEVPLSSSLERVFDSAKALQVRLQHSEIEPLHLLAAILTDESSQGVQSLQGSGITQEKVLRRLSGAIEN